MVDKPIQLQPIAKFVVDYRKHETLEQAFKENYRQYFLPLDPQEALRDLNGGRRLFTRLVRGTFASREFAADIVWRSLDGDTATS